MKLQGHPIVNEPIYTPEFLSLQKETPLSFPSLFKGSDSEEVQSSAPLECIRTESTEKRTAVVVPLIEKVNVLKSVSSVQLTREQETLEPSKEQDTPQTFPNNEEWHTQQPAPAFDPICYECRHPLIRPEEEQKCVFSRFLTI